MWSLSGGNQQRVVLARELSHEPRVLVAAQPTRGLDVGAIEYMSARLREVAAAGVGVLLISTELEEILDLVRSDRRDVEGRIVGEMPRGDVDLDRLGLLMGGADRVSDVRRAIVTDAEEEEVAAAARQRSRLRRDGEVVVLYAICLVGRPRPRRHAGRGDGWIVDRRVHGDPRRQRPQARPVGPDPRRVAAPILLVGLGTIVNGRAGLVNIGQEGQLVIGACFAALRRVPLRRARSARCSS